MKPDIRMKWLTALQSGNYKQAQNVLFNPEQGSHCCLGVLCEVVGLKKETYQEEIYPGNTKEYARFLLPDGTIMRESLNHNLLHDLGLTQHEESQLIYLNDELKASFQQIATFIDRFIKPTYTEGVDANNSQEIRYIPEGSVGPSA